MSVKNVKESEPKYPIDKVQDPYLNQATEDPYTQHVAADPYPAICWSRQSTMNDVKEEFDLPRGVWGGENDKNVVGITTPGLLEGLGCPIYV